MASGKSWLRQAGRVSRVLARSPAIDKTLRVPLEEFRARQRRVIDLGEAVQRRDASRYPF